jgi:hypothetical protein
MVLKNSLFLIFVFASQLLFAQAKTAEIGIISDNDLYTSSKYVLYKWIDAFLSLFLYKDSKTEINKIVQSLD